MEPKPSVTMVAFGRTGSGKSALGNKIAGKEGLFKEGHSMRSETLNTIQKDLAWPLDTSIRVNFIDTPGFADNRSELSNTELLANILKYLDGLRGGFNVGLFCMQAKGKVDLHDIEELEMLGALLGHEVFQHTWIVITQANTLEYDKRKEVYTRIPSELPEILREHELGDFWKDRIIFADFDDFERQFLQPIHAVISCTSKYEPQVSKNIDLNDPDSLLQFMQSPAIKNLMERYEKMFAEKKQQLEQINEVVKEQSQTNKLLQKQVEKRERDIDRLNDKIQDMEKRRKDIEEQMHQSEIRQQDVERKAAEERRLLNDRFTQEENKRKGIEQQVQQAKICQQDTERKAVEERRLLNERFAQEENRRKNIEEQMRQAVIHQQEAERRAVEERRLLNERLTQEENRRKTMELQLKKAEEEKSLSATNKGDEYCKQANKYYHTDKNYMEGFKYYKMAAEAGNAEAQWRLGWIYQVGLEENHVHEPQDLSKAILLYRQAAAQGRQEAMGALSGLGALTPFKTKGDEYCCLANVYYHIINPKNYMEGFKYYKMAAAAGNAEAQHVLGWIYEVGPQYNNVYEPKDLPIAILLYKQAAAQGRQEAITALRHLGV